MDKSIKYIPFGSLPYEDVNIVAKMIAKLHNDIPYVPILPKINANDNILSRTLSKIPGVCIKGEKIKLSVATKLYNDELSKLEKAFNHPNIEHLEHFSIEAPFMEKFFQLIKKFKSQYALINLLGPFTITQMLTEVAEEQMLIDKTYRKLFIQSICVKALWAIKKIKEISPNTIPIIMLEEPLFYNLGVFKKNNEEITTELIVKMFARVFGKLKGEGALVGMQCFKKCDWQVPILAGIDIISFDAYNNPNNLNIIPEQVTDFLLNGGKINWGIIPPFNEEFIKNLSLEILTKRLFLTMDGLISSGVPLDLLYKNSTISIQTNMENLPVIFAEKAVFLSNQLANKLTIKDWH